MTEAITFRAEPDFMDAIRENARELGISVNAALRRMLSSALGLDEKTGTAIGTDNGLMKFCGALKGLDPSEMRKAQESFSEIDEEMWK